MATLKGGSMKKASDGRVTTKKEAINPNPSDRTVYMEGGRMPKKMNGMKKKGY